MVGTDMFKQCDVGEFGHDINRIGRSRVAVSVHLVEVVVLEAHRAFTVPANPLWEEDHAVYSAFAGHDVDGHRRARRLGPRNLEAVMVELHKVDLLALDPSPTDVAGMDPTVDGAAVLDVHLVAPAVGIGVDEPVSNDRRQVLWRNRILDDGRGAGLRSDPVA